MVHFTRLPNGALTGDNAVNYRLSELDNALVQGELFGPASVRTISSGEVVIDGGYQIIAAETGTTDNLDTITPEHGTVTPRIIVLRADTGDTITVTHNVGNIKTRTSASITLAGNELLTFFWDGTQYANLGSGPHGDLGVRAQVNASPTIANDTLTLVELSTETQFMTVNIHSLTANPGRITISKAGVYDIDAHSQLSGNAVGYRELVIRLNGATIIARVRKHRAPSIASLLQVSTIYKLNVGDYVEMLIRQTSGGDLVTGTTYPANHAFIAKLLTG